MGLSKKEREALDLGEPGKGREWIIDEDRSEAILFDNNKMSVVSRHDLPNNEVRGNEAVQRKRSVDVRNAPRNTGSSAASLAIRGEHRTDANVQMDPSVVPRTPRGSEVAECRPEGRWKSHSSSGICAFGSCVIQSSWAGQSSDNGCEAARGSG